jgi:hypothetical protein
LNSSDSLGEKIPLSNLVVAWGEREYRIPMTQRAKCCAGYYANFSRSDLAFQVPLWGC